MWYPTLLSFSMQLIIHLSKLQVYAPDFIAHVRLKQRLAELQFSQLCKFARDYAGSGKSCAVKDTIDQTIC
jgi:hypothetical protein